MDSKGKKPRQGDMYRSQDADFGVFQPTVQPIVDTTQFPSNAGWTQFSGIPPSPGDMNGFGWDSFVTPPNTPAAGPNVDLNPNFYSNLNNVMQAMGKNSTNFDANVTNDTDKLASTPLAQSLLEALSSSNPVMNTMPDDSIPMQSLLDFDQTSQDGFDIYTEALKKLGSGYPAYDPFGTSDVLSSSPSATQPPKEVVDQHSRNVKPSFADVTKTLKSNQNSSKERDEIDLGKRRSSEITTSRSFKGSKKFVPRAIRGRNNSVPDDMCRTTVSPDSKYGLDDFGDIDVKKTEKDQLTSGLENIPVITRKNSNSSLSSGTSGIEEIHLTKACNHGNSYSGEETTAFEKISNKDKEKGFEKENVKSASKDEKPFFDARRIFQTQTKDTNKRRGQSKLVDEDAGPTILNNGKPSYAAWCSTAAPKKSTHYINNNLRDSQKKTNQNPSSGMKGQTSSAETAFPQSQSRGEKPARTRQGSAKSRSTTAKPEMPLQTSFDHELIDEWLSFLYDKAKLCLHQLWTLVLMVILLIFSIIVYLVSGCVHIFSWLWGKLWMFLENKVFKGKLFGGDRWRKTVNDTPKKIGLEENIGLPTTGEEAMQRLLAGKGKDPYSILGLKSTATDDDIKKYYRRQAVLVHPDKNQQPGAEEAFKILGHAFDLIGDASKRETYDRQLQEAKEAEAAMREFNDLLTKLQEKIQQASNMMKCDNCSGKHKRVPVDRPWYSARFCDRCKIRHSAKEGDVWAETSMFGFLWHYYACMEGKVFDITEWVACKKEFFKHMQANAHHVFYRIATEGNKGHRGRANADKHGRSNTDKNGQDTAGASSEGDLEDFISHLFHQAMNSDTANSSQSWQHPQTNGGQPWNSSTPSQPPGTSTGGKRQRRKKKKH